MPEVKIRILRWEGNTEAFCYQITNSICILIRKTAHESKIQLKNYIFLVDIKNYLNRLRKDQHNESVKKAKLS